MKPGDHRGAAVFPAPIGSTGRRSLLCGLAALALLAGCDQNTPLPGKQSSAESTSASPAPPIRGPAVLPDHGGSANVGNQPHTWSIAWDGREPATSMPAVLRADGGLLVAVADNAAGDRLSHADKSFIKDAAVGGLFEVEAAQVASERARDPAVRTFAEMLATQHGAANSELKQLAGSRNVDLPGELPMLKQHAVDKLRKTPPEKFDHEFVNEVGIKDHEKDIKRFEKASREVKDPEVRAWAEKTLPTLRRHLDEARRLPMAAGPTQASHTSGPAGATSGGGGR